MFNEQELISNIWLELVLRYVVGTDFSCLIGINFKSVTGIIFECVIDISFECDIGIHDWH